MAIALVLSSTAVAQEEGDGEAVTTFGDKPAATETSPAAMTPATTEPTDEAPEAVTPEPAAEPLPADVIQQLLDQRPTSPPIEPSQVMPDDDLSTSELRPDPRVIGTAPGLAPSQLRREGEFIISRRGRLMVQPGGRTQFRFEADGEKSPEAPMLMLPCRLLETMEKLSEQRGEGLVFILSGQVFVYHGENWLLPTMMKLDFDRGNLQN